MLTVERFAHAMQAMRDRPTVVFATPNYEERSSHAVVSLLTAYHEAQGDPARLAVFSLWPQGSVTRVGLLEALKREYFNQVRPLLKHVKNETVVVPYPDNYNERLPSDVIRNGCSEFPGEEINVVVDISAMPRRILIPVCRALTEVLARDQQRIHAIYFWYTSPRRYASLNYAQNVGAIQGHYSGRPLHECTADHVTALLFPSLQGYEARLLFDEFRNRTSRSITGFIAAGGKDYMTAIATMRANQFLMEQREATLIYYYSLRDGIKKLAGAIDYERMRAASSAERGGERLVVVAPFGPKVFTLAAYFGLEEIRHQPGVTVEIAHVSGFQYLSVYSLGVGESVVMKLAGPLGRG